uniref:Uncharacterized protein LOC100371360 n=1 Tax=Saccoglossus kowalevskii TaxID=10224 RepID=A0ABM0GPJ2_SACKO|nr:PREDICTED: uncharacterized protein LOC100371360 [Saccoglossus kowalevskii]
MANGRRMLVFLLISVLLCVSVDCDCKFDSKLLGDWILFDSKHQIDGEYRIDNKTIHPPRNLLYEQSIGNIKCIQKRDNIYLLANVTVKSFSPFREEVNNYICSVFTHRSANFIEWMQYAAQTQKYGGYSITSSCQGDVIEDGQLPDMSKYGRWTPLYAKYPTSVACPLNTLFHYAFTHTHDNGAQVYNPKLDGCTQLDSFLDAGCTNVDTFHFDYSRCARKQANSDVGDFSCLATWSSNYTYRYHFTDRYYGVEWRELQYVILRNKDEHIADNSTGKYFCYVWEHQWLTYGNESDPDADSERYTYMSGVPVMCPPEIRPKPYSRVLLQNRITSVKR